MKNIIGGTLVGACFFATVMVGCGGGTSNSTGGAGSGGGTGGGGGAGGGSNATCGVAPCGGDLLGNWSFTGVCINPGLLMEQFTVDNCPTSTVSNVEARETGTMAFTATNYTAQVMTTLSLTMNVPNSCLDGQTCAQFNTTLQAQIAADPNVQSVSCTGTSLCACRFVMTPSSTSEAGTYSTSGSMLSTTPAFGTAGSVQYCVQGNIAHFMSIEAGAAMRTLSDEIAQRQ